MANQSVYNKKDIPQFQENVCKKRCVCNEHCIEEGKDEQNFLMCPLYHAWKFGYWSFVWDQILWEREHPEEAEQKHKDLVTRAKAWGDEQRKLKRDAKAKEKAEKITKGEIEEKPKKTRTKKSK